MEQGREQHREGTLQSQCAAPNVQPRLVARNTEGEQPEGCQVLTSAALRLSCRSGEDQQTGPSKSRYSWQDG